MACSAIRVNNFSSTSLSDDKILLQADLVVTYSSDLKTLSTIAFVDDGCTGFALLDSDFASRNNIPLVPLDTSYSVTLANGSIAGRIDFKTKPLTLRLGHHQEEVSFLVTKLSSVSPVTLGLPWMRLHNPTVNWKTLTLSFADCTSHSVNSIGVAPTDGHSLPLLRDSRYFSQQPTSSSSQDIELFNARAFLAHARKHNLDIFTAQLDVRLDGPSPTVSISSVLTKKEYAKTRIPLDSRGVPIKYQAFGDVFHLKTESPTPLPPHRSYDLAIEFVRGPDGQEATLPKPGKVYPLSRDEEKELEEFLTKALARGWISNSTSPLGAPCFFVKKPNGGLRLCIDYRSLNAITKKNRYPLPLSQELLDKLCKARVFTHLDLPDAYHLIRIKKGDEWKTAFRCKFGHYEYNVIPFGLSNAPAAFQFFMNDIFADILGLFVVIYLDDILIFSESFEEHEQHVKIVLQRLRDHQLSVNPLKCSFDLTEVDFLGMIVSTDGLKMDSAKVSAVEQWPAPKSVREIQVFLGFANFYRRFIQDFSCLARPLTKLTAKDVAFDWTQDADAAFSELKRRFTSAPILRYFDFDKQAVLETDASDFAIGAVLSQFDDDGILHPVAFFSRQLLAAEINYDTYDKELLAIVEAFSHWRHYLMPASPEHPTLVFSDHDNLTRFTSTQQLSRRQYRWSQKLAEFHFRIYHRPGKRNGKPDALSRRPDFSRNSLTHTNYLQLFQQISVESLSILGSNESLLAEIKSATSTSSLLIAFHARTLSDEYELRDGILYFRDLIVLPTEKLQLQIFQQRHCTPVAGHFGLAKTVELICRDFYWPRIRQTIRRFIKNCDVCNRAKPSRHAPYGLLQALPVPQERWWDISMDFLTDLPPSNGHDSILVVKDRLSKQAHFLPTTKTINAEETACLFVREIFRLHGCPRSIVSDRGPQFTAAFWRRFQQLLGTSVNLSTAHHPQTDGSTEILNQTIEHYLRIYCNYQQNDWYSHIPLAEFTYNNSVNSSTEMTPFYANQGHHPLFDPAVIRESRVPAAEERVLQLQTILDDLKANLRAAQQAYSEQANKSRLPSPSLAIGDLVFLDRRHIPSLRPSSKLDNKKLGPFKISRIINPVAYELKLPSTLRIHPVFHVSLLEPRTKDIIKEFLQPEPPPVIVDSHEEFEVEQILDSRIRHRQLQYLVRWKGYSPADDTWEPATHLLNSPDLIHDFHQQNPTKPKPMPGGPRLRRG